MNKTEAIALWLRDRGKFTTTLEVANHFGWSMARTASLITMMISTKRYTTQVKSNGRGRTRYVKVVNVKPEYISGVQEFLASIDTSLYTVTQMTEMYENRVSRECIRTYLRTHQMKYRVQRGVRLDIDPTVNKNDLINKVFR